MLRNGLGVCWVGCCVALVVGAGEPQYLVVDLEKTGGVNWDLKKGPRAYLSREPALERE